MFRKPDTGLDLGLGFRKFSFTRVRATIGKILNMTIPGISKMCALLCSAQILVYSGLAATIASFLYL